MNSKLAISIPSYNRAEILRDNLKVMLPEIKSTGISVYISDDSTDDRVKDICNELTKEYSNIFFSHNSPGLGHDRNCLNSLTMPTADYIWYLGDGGQIKPGGIKRVLEIIDAWKPDFIFVGAEHRKHIELPSGHYFNPQLLLEKLAWHLTLTGVTIYRRDCLGDIYQSYSKFYDTNFIQLGIILENAVHIRDGYFFENKDWHATHPKKFGSYWEKRIFEVFMKDWTDFVLSLNEAYTLSSKKIAIRAHSKKTGILRYYKLWRYRRNGIFSFSMLISYRPYWKLATGIPWPALLPLFLVPTGLINFYRRIIGE